MKAGEFVSHKRKELEAMQKHATGAMPEQHARFVHGAMARLQKAITIGEESSRQLNDAGIKYRDTMLRAYQECLIASNSYDLQVPLVLLHSPWPVGIFQIPHNNHKSQGLHSHTTAHTMAMFCAVVLLCAIWLVLHSTNFTHAMHPTVTRHPKVACHGCHCG